MLEVEASKKRLSSSSSKISRIAAHSFAGTGDSSIVVRSLSNSAICSFVAAPVAGAVIMREGAGPRPPNQIAGLQRVQHHAKRIFIERLDSPALRKQAHRRDLGHQRHHTLQHAGTIEDFRHGMNLDLIHIPIVIRFPSICQQSLKRLARRYSRPQDGAPQSSFVDGIAEWEEAGWNNPIGITQLDYGDYPIATK